MRYVNLILLIPSLLFAQNPLSAIYRSLDPTSITQHFAFYELYPDTELGKKALEHAWSLLHGGERPEILPSVDIQPLINTINPSSEPSSPPLLSEEQLNTIEQLARNLSNRSLRGFGAWEMATIDRLPPEEIDVTRGIFLSEMEKDDAEARRAIRSYEAHLDLMALQILARLPSHPTSSEKIRVINDYIFRELRFRFPPHSLWMKNIDLYTQLPSVLDNRRGVCLGVSVLYLGLAQRLDLPLEAVTPPGHIFVRYKDPETQDVINIETTARGIDLPTETYLGIETKAIPQRTLREVIGLVLMNRASVSWHRGDVTKTIELYERAQHFLPDDYLLTMFLGYNYLFAKNQKKGTELLKKLPHLHPPYLIGDDTISEDFLLGKTDATGIAAVYAEIDEKRSSILEKQQKLKTIVDRFPEFRQGIFHLAITHLQIARDKEAIPLLERYALLAPRDPTAHYYLAALYYQRLHFANAWQHLRSAEKIVHDHQYDPKALKELHRALQQSSPESLEKY